ncbi:MAG: alpha/beta fold hydrolase [Planctomycetota bacterium]|nr:alpha/beta fold hydrolase [Planctomycetota bacterium]
MVRKSTRLSIKGKQGNLAGILEEPVSNPKAFGIFSHCFSCTKDLKAIVKISRILAEHGYAVLRFDFAGLGNSEGEFSETTFLDNLNDVRSVVDFLSQSYTPAKFLLGHSLGGSAMLATGMEFHSIEAISVIASPSETTHLANTLIQLNPGVEQNGEGLVNTGTYEYLIKKTTIDVLRNYDLMSQIRKLKKRVLAFHSLGDTTLGMDHAESIVKETAGPASLINLEQANHLLTDHPQDCEFIGKTLATWFDRYLTC